MASVVRHPHTGHFDVPARAYWTAGIGLALLALVLAYFSMTSPSHVAAVSPFVTEPMLPFVPFVPML